MIGPVRTGKQGLHRRQEIIGNRAADAAIGKLDNILLGAVLVATGFQNIAIDPQIAEFIDDKGKFPPTRRLQQMANKARLTGTKKAGDDGCGDFLPGIGCGHDLSVPYRRSL